MVAAEREPQEGSSEAGRSKKAFMNTTPLQARRKKKTSFSLFLCFFFSLSHSVYVFFIASVTDPEVQTAEGRGLGGVLGRPDRDVSAASVIW